MKKRLAVLVAMGTLAAFSLGAEAKTYAVEDEDGNTKYITVYDGKVETTIEEDEEIKTEASDLYDWEEGEAVDDDTSEAYAVSEYTYVTGDLEGTMDEEEFLKAEQKRVAEYENWGQIWRLYLETMSMSFWTMTVPFTWSGDDSKPTALPSYRETRDGKATDVEAVTAREILEKMAEQDLKKTDKE